jgi:hypothetical protein
MKGRHITLIAILGVVLIAIVVIAFSFFSRSVATVRGKVTNTENEPVAGQILFSPQGDSTESTGPPVLARIDDDGNYKVELKTTGLYRVVVNPRDLADETVPKSKLAWWRKVDPGQNEIDISIRLRKKSRPKP